MGERRATPRQNVGVRLRAPLCWLENTKFQNELLASGMGWKLFGIENRARQIQRGRFIFHFSANQAEILRLFWRQIRRAGKGREKSDKGRLTAFRQYPDSR